MNKNVTLFLRSVRSNVLLLILLGMFIILRLPSLFEPHWYGDEGIYASIAYALEHGKKLYIDVFDNRLPGIYYLYSLGGTENRLLFVRFVNMIAGLVSLIGIYALGKKLQLKQASFLALTLAVLLLGTPAIEGNIANTENFFIPFTIWGVWFALSTKYKHLFIAGICFGCSFLIKFPPFFTFLAIILYDLFSHNIMVKERLNRLCMFFGGFIAVLAVAFLVLAFIGNINEAIKYGLLNNSHYVNYYNEQGIPVSVKAAVLAIILIVVTGLYLKKILPNTVFLLVLLLMLDYFAVLFSGRKYEHYLLQIVPALSLITAYSIERLSRNNKWLYKAVFLLCFLSILFIGRLVFDKGVEESVKLNISAYYREFMMSLAGKKIENSRMPFTFFKEYTILERSKQAIENYHTKNIYFYSDMSWVYDYNHIVPPTFFVAMYHQYLIPDGTKRLVLDLERNRPRVIAVERNKDQTDEFRSFLSNNYVHDKEDEYFVYYLDMRFITENI